MGKLVSNLIYYIPGILLLGIMTSYEDIKYGKIRNKWIIGAIAYFFLVFFALYFFDTPGLTHTPHFLIETATNAIFALMLGFLLWNTGIWTAGDGKLFFAFALLIPVTTYARFYVSYVPSFMLIIYIFTPLFLIMLIWLIAKTSKKQKMHLIKEAINPKHIFVSAVGLFAILWIIQLILGIFHIQHLLLSSLIAFIAFRFITELLGDKFIYFLVVVAILRFFLDKSIYTWNYLIYFTIIILIFVIFMTVMVEASFLVFTVETKIEYLKEGMILAENVVRKKNSEGKYVKHKIIIMHSNDKDSNYIIEPSAEGLNSHDLHKIRKLYKENELSFDSIKVQNTIAFGPFMFVGALIALLIH